MADDGTDAATGLRHLALLLEAGAPQPSTFEDRAKIVVGQLMAFRRQLDAADTRNDLIKAAAFNIGCLTIGGRATILEQSMAAAEQLNRDFPEADVSWQDVARLPTITQDHLIRIAKTLNDLASKLGEGTHNTPQFEPGRASATISMTPKQLRIRLGVNPDTLRSIAKNAGVQTPNGKGHSTFRYGSDAVEKICIWIIGNPTRSDVATSASDLLEVIRKQSE